MKNLIPPPTAQNPAAWFTYALQAAGTRSILLFRERLEVAAIKTILFGLITILVGGAPSFAQTCGEGVFLGRLSSNPYASASTANPYGQYGSAYSTTSINNRFSPWGSAYSSTSAANPYATSAPKIIAADGTYLGRLSANPYAADSVSNPYGKYGSPYSATSINNPYGNYGSSYSSMSPNNPYSTSAPVLSGQK